METSTKIKLVSVIVLLVGPGLAFVGWQSKQLVASLEKDGVVTSAEIVGGEWKKGRKGGKTYKFDVAFTPKGAGVRTQNFEVTSEYFSQHASEDAITNPKAEVRYLPTDPSKAMVVGGSTDDAVLFPIGIVMGLAGAGVLGFMMTRPKQEAAQA